MTSASATPPTHHAMKESLMHKKITATLAAVTLAAGLSACAPTNGAAPAAGGGNTKSLKDCTMTMIPKNTDNPFFAAGAYGADEAEPIWAAGRLTTPVQLSPMCRGRSSASRALPSRAVAESPCRASTLCVGTRFDSRCVPRNQSNQLRRRRQKGRPRALGCPGDGRIARRHPVQASRRADGQQGQLRDHFRPEHRSRPERLDRSSRRGSQKAGVRLDEPSRRSTATTSPRRPMTPPSRSSRPTPSWTESSHPPPFHSRPP